MNRQIVTLKTVRYLPEIDSNGQAKQEAINVKLPYPSQQWDNYMKTLRFAGFNKVEVEQVTDEEVTLVTMKKKGKDFTKQVKKYTVVDTPSKIIEAVKTALAKPEVELTPEQKEIAELKAAIAELRGANAEPKKEAKKVEPKEEESNDSDLDAARAEYKEAFEKKPHHSWSAEQIREKIKELQES